MGNLYVVKIKRKENKIMKNKTLPKYKDYIGTIEYDETDKIYWGEILGIEDSVSYHGENPNDLYTHYKIAVNDYLDFLKSKVKGDSSERSNKNI